MNPFSTVLSWSKIIFVLDLIILCVFRPWRVFWEDESEFATAVPLDLFCMFFSVQAMTCKFIGMAKKIKVAFKKIRTGKHKLSEAKKVVESCKPLDDSKELHYFALVVTLATICMFNLRDDSVVTKAAEEIFEIPETDAASITDFVNTLFILSVSSLTAFLMLFFKHLIMWEEVEFAIGVSVEHLKIHHPDKVCKYKKCFVIPLLVFSYFTLIVTLLNSVLSWGVLQRFCEGYCVYIKVAMYIVIIADALYFTYSYHSITKLHQNVMTNMQQQNNFVSHKKSKARKQKTDARDILGAWVIKDFSENLTADPQSKKKENGVDAFLEEGVADQ